LKFKAFFYGVKASKKLNNLSGKNFLKYTKLIFDAYDIYFVKVNLI